MKTKNPIISITVIKFFFLHVGNYKTLKYFPWGKSLLLPPSQTSPTRPCPLASLETGREGAALVGWAVEVAGRPNQTPPVTFGCLALQATAGWLQTLPAATSRGCPQLPMAACGGGRLRASSGGKGRLNLSLYDRHMNNKCLKHMTIYLMSSTINGTFINYK